MKAQAVVAAWPRIADRAAALGVLLDAATLIDCNRPRATRGWRTAIDADETLAHGSVHTTRERVYATARCRTRRAVVDCPDGRARRRAIREAILSTFEECNLIRRHRGRKPPSASFAEDVS